jgi:ribose transport system permease protein
MTNRPRLRLAAVLSDYGMLIVLLALGGIFSAATITEHRPEGAAAGEQVADLLFDQFEPHQHVVVLAQNTELDRAYAAALAAACESAERPLPTLLQGDPRTIRRGLEELAAASRRIDVLAVTPAIRSWPLVADLPREFPALGRPVVLSPQPYRWPTFLKRDNLLNISNQIAEIAIVAVGMTVVIITGGIDLSVGSLIGLAAMIACLLIQDYGGGREAGVGAMTLSSLAGIGACGLFGLFSGVMVTLFRVPPFVVTLGVMLAARGLAGMLTGGAAAHLVPAAYTTFASGRLFGLPHAVWMMMALYVVAHVLMSRTRLGRHIYAVGGNRLAAHLSGIPTHRVLLFAYVLSGLMAGLAGIVMASRLKSANPTFGKSYELYVIAAVVVGGTSLAGGSGKILGTLIGALIIAVMQNGMNLLNGLKIVRIDDFGQDVVLGAVLLAAVVFDQVKRQGVRSWHRLE